MRPTFKQVLKAIIARRTKKEVKNSTIRRIVRILNIFKGRPSG